MSDYKLEISGFKSEAEVKAFVLWYEGQGEQDAIPWFEEMKMRKKIDRDFMPVDCGKTYPLDVKNNVGYMFLK